MGAIENYIAAEGDLRAPLLRRSDPIVTDECQKMSRKSELLLITLVTRWLVLLILACSHCRPARKASISTRKNVNLALGAGQRDLHRAERDVGVEVDAMRDRRAPPQACKARRHVCRQTIDCRPADHIASGKNRLHNTVER